METWGSGDMEPRVGSWSWLGPPFPSWGSAAHQQHSSGKGSVSKFTVSGLSAQVFSRYSFLTFLFLF